MIQAHGLAHVTVTVPDIQTTKKFYDELFETEFDLDNYISFGMLKVGIPCWFTESAVAKNQTFNEQNIGLNHVAFKLETLNELENIIKKLDKMKIKNKGIERYAGLYPYVAFDDINGIYMEFFIPEE